MRRGAGAHRAPATPSRSSLSQRHVRPTAATPFALYRALRAVNPSPYMVFLDFGNLQIVSASPETHVSLTPRGPRDAQADRRLAPARRRRRRGRRARRASSRRDEKERAEHLMLVDLARNDLGRVCAPGTVEVAKALEVERYSHIMHLVSQVEGRLRDGEDALLAARGDVPRRHRLGRAEGARDADHLGDRGHAAAASTPARSATSATTASLDTCIALRTIVMRDGLALLQAGAGIVADSVPGERARGVPATRSPRSPPRSTSPRRGGTGDDARSPRPAGNGPVPARVLLVDNYDSFTYNLAHLLCEAGADVDVQRHDAVDERRGRGARADAPRHLPRPRPAGRGRRLDRR